MKPINTFLIISFLLITSQVNGQFAKVFVAGLNLTNLRASDFTKTHNRKGIGIGGDIDLNLGRKIDLHLIPMYSQKGNKVSEGLQKLAPLLV